MRRVRAKLRSAGYCRGLRGGVRRGDYQWNVEGYVAGLRLWLRRRRRELLLRWSLKGLKKSMQNITTLRRIVRLLKKLGATASVISWAYRAPSLTELCEVNRLWGLDKSSCPEDGRAALKGELPPACCCAAAC